MRKQKHTLKKLTKDFLQPLIDADNAEDFDYSGSRHQYYFDGEDADSRMDILLKYCPKFKKFFDEIEKEEYERDGFAMMKPEYKEKYEKEHKIKPEDRR